MKNKQKIKVIKNGPYEVSGGVPLAKDIVTASNGICPDGYKKGQEYPKQESYRLCRCGKSSDKPFCDLSHMKNGFDGTETSDNIPYEEQAELIEGPDLLLKDARSFCSGARFCDRASGTWQLTLDSDDPECKKMAIETACNCTSGRLTACDKKTGKAIEPELEPSIGLIEDEPAGVSGPLRVKGGIPVESADGGVYEIRNRMTLCRCGQSGNKPFCDGSHISSGFSDEN
jgi:CDGSH-type Zn-finger protein